jgi:hypothetical protein
VEPTAGLLPTVAKHKGRVGSFGCDVIHLPECSRPSVGPSLNHSLQFIPWCVAEFRVSARMQQTIRWSESQSQPTVLWSYL